MNVILNILKGIAKLAPIKTYRMAAYRRAFFAPGSQWPRFYGLFKSRSEAECADSTKSVSVGYDHPGMESVSLEIMTKTWTSDYPVLFWLSRVLRDQKGLFDLGGHIGTKYRAWRAYLNLPNDFIWTVCDLPNIVQAGKNLSADFPQLQFTTDRAAASGQHVLLTSGALQYADFDLNDVLNELPVKPIHILINKIPCHSQANVFTLEKIGDSVVPYRIFDSTGFIDKLQDMGYALVDQWTVQESCVRVPFTNLGEPVHFGFYLRNDKVSVI